MLDERYNRVLSVVRGEGYSDEYPSVSAFKKYSKEGNLQEEEVDGKWVFCEHDGGNTNQVQARIKDLLRYLIHTQNTDFHCLVQFWAAVEVGRQAQFRLSTKHQPFFVSYLNKGSCKYRNRCSDYVYDDDDDGDGGVRRAYLRKDSESTPDLRFYSTKEFPMRDCAARCGFTGYLALPLFDLLTNRCYGVLEILSCFTISESFLLSSLYQGLQIAGMRSTHTSLSPIGRYTTNMPSHEESEMTEILELAIKAIPGLYLAQVWIPCKQCPNKRCCMEIASFINSGSKKVYLYDAKDKDMLAYLLACQFHHQQIDVACIHQNSCDLITISQDPLAHYKARARLSFCHTVSLRNKSNGSYVIIDFFLQPNCRQDAGGDSSLQLLLRLMKAKFESFELEWCGKQQLIPEQLVAIEPEYSDMLKVMNLHGEAFPEADLTKYLGNDVELPGLQGSRNGWVLCSPNREGSKSLCTGTPVTNKIELFLKNIAFKFMTNWYRMAQFWAPTEVEGRCYLETSHQPYALGFLANGLAFFRKECTKHRYCVDHTAKEEELGPPGRVFKNGFLEISPDISFYSVEDFFLRTYALHCGFQEYIALTVFDEDNPNCVGVLELIGFSYYDLYSIKQELEEVKLSSSLIDPAPRFLANELDNNIVLSRTEALVELRDAFNLIRMIPQLHKASVWVPTNTDMSCMELALSSESTSQFMPIDQVHVVRVQPKKGIIGRVLASESQSCFCRNLRGFSIADQPLSHYEMSERRDVCFAISLQSSLTQDLVYVLEFFLYQGPATYEYLNSFLSFLLPVMKQTLKTFKMASGIQLGAEFVVEVIEFSEANKLTSSEPVKFKSVPYVQKEGQDTEEQLVESVSCAKQADGCSEALNDLSTVKDDNSAATCSLKKKKGGKRRTDSKLSFEVLKNFFGQKLEYVEQATSCSRSTIKRVCRENGVPRWPSQPYHTESSLVSERDTLQKLQASTSSNHLLLEESSQHVISQEEKLTVKVRYKDTIRFEFFPSMGLDKLSELVSIKLNLERSSFKLKYIDEDVDEILLASDDDLQFCPKSKTATGKTCIHLLVQLISD